LSWQSTPNCPALSQRSPDSGMARNSEQIHLSVVAVSRNDDHGGNMRARMQQFVNGLAAQCDRYSLRAELVLVEWNPPENRPPLAEALVWPTRSKMLDVRIVTVPRELHVTLGHSEALPLFQMIGKNVGIRRARGRYVLATNVDILFDHEIMRHIGRSLRPGELVRVDRFDVPSNLPAGPVDAILKFCAEKAFHVQTRHGVYDIASAQFLPHRDNVRDMVHALNYCRQLSAGRLRERRRHGLEDFSPSGSELGLWARLSRSIRRRLVLGALYGEAVLSDMIHVTKIVGIIVTAALRAGRRIVAWFWRHFWPPVPLLRKVRSAGRAMRNHAPRVRASIERRVRGAIEAIAAVALRRADDRKRKALHRPAHAHTQACGDFTLMAREDWHRLRGYLELHAYSWHIDSVLVHAAIASGIRVNALKPSCRIYHMDHSKGSGWSVTAERALFSRLDAEGIPHLNNHDLDRWIDWLERGRGSRILNDADWGFGNAELKETVVHSCARTTVEWEANDGAEVSHFSDGSECADRSTRNPSRARDGSSH